MKGYVLNADEPVADAIVPCENNLAYLFAPRRKTFISAMLLQNLKTIYLRQ